MSVNRRKVLFITQSVMALTALALALLTFSGQISALANLCPDRPPGGGDRVRYAGAPVAGAQPGAGA